MQQATKRLKKRPRKTGSNGNGRSLSCSAFSLCDPRFRGLEARAEEEAVFRRQTTEALSGIKAEMRSLSNNVRVLCRASGLNPDAPDAPDAA